MGCIVPIASYIYPPRKEPCLTSLFTDNLGTIRKIALVVTSIASDIDVIVVLLVTCLVVNGLAIRSQSSLSLDWFFS
jgi:hypothetical protein